MIDRRPELVGFTHEWEPGGSAEVLWRERLGGTAGWPET
jgi:hypothetical protein